MMSNYFSRVAIVALGSVLAMVGPVYAHAGSFTGSIGAIYVQPHVDSPVLGAQASHDTQPVVDLSYDFTEHLALVTQIAFPRHEISIGGISQGSVSLAPFNLTAQYHFLPGRKFSPYLGIGINHTVFFNQGGNLSGFERFGPSTGGVLQAGLRYHLNKEYFINLGVAKWYIKTDVTPKGSAKLETMKLNPVTVSITYGMYF